MYHHRTLFLLLTLFLFLSNSDLNSQPLTLPADSVTYLWPTDASRQLSSTFAETRSAHLHAGLDIRTWGREGYRVFATRDGIIHRIGMSPFGYGNVIYMRHGDDTYSVYAHLNRFEPALQAFADSIRLQNYSADLNLIVEEHQFHFRQGDLIGFTGGTGVGPPHLHFELRDTYFRPFNPLLTNIRVEDNIAPVFRQLGVEYLDSNTYKPLRFDLFDAISVGNRYDFGNIKVDGPVGLSVNVHDRADQTPNHYAVYSLTVVQDADTLFHAAKDNFSYLHARHIFLDRSYQILAQTRRGFQRLYVVEGNELPFYKIKKNRGVIHFEEGIYPLVIIASDIYGNRTRANLALHVSGNQNPPEEITYVPTYPELIEARIQSPHIYFTDIPLSASANTQISIKEQSLISYDRVRHLFPFRSGQSVRKKIEPGKTSVLTTPDRNIWLQIPKHALYDTLDVRLTVERVQNEILFHFEPDRLPLNAPIYFNFILPDDLIDNQQLALFTNDKFQERQFYLSSSRAGRLLRASMNEISSMILKEDNLAPWIGRARIDRNNAGNYIVIVPARDGLTGIDYRRSSISVNGQSGITEYDPEKDILIYYHPNFKPSRSNNVRIEVYDGVGNLTSREVTLSY